MYYHLFSEPAQIGHSLFGNIREHSEKFDAKGGYV